MNKLLPVLILLVLAAFGIGGFLVLSNKKPATSNKEQTQLTNNEAMTTPSSEKSLKDLIGLGTAQECTFRDETGNGGVVYVGNSNMRGDFSTVGPQGTVSSHIIVDGQTTYMWMEGQASGYKMSFDGTTDTATGANSQQSVDLNQRANYDCKTWIVNSSMFALPAGVTFTDYGTMKIPTGSESCATCDSLPAAAKAACRETLKCE